MVVRRRAERGSPIRADRDRVRGQRLFALLRLGEAPRSARPLRRQCRALWTAGDALGDDRTQARRRIAKPRGARDWPVAGGLERRRPRPRHRRARGAGPAADPWPDPGPGRGAQWAPLRARRGGRALVAAAHALRRGRGRDGRASAPLARRRLRRPERRRRAARTRLFPLDLVARRDQPGRDDPLRRGPAARPSFVARPEL